MKKIYRILALALALSMLCGCFAACTNNDNEEPPTEGPTSEKTEPPTDNKEDPTDGKDQPSETETSEQGTEPDENKNMILKDYAKPFWNTDTMYDETVMLIAKTDAQGNVIEAPRAKLLFDANEIKSVTWYFHEKNGNEVKTFKEGTDFTYENGYIVANGTIVESPVTEIKEFSTNMPYVTDKMLTGQQAFPGLSLISDIPSKTNGLYLPFTEGYQIVQMQLCVTYTHTEKWQGSVPAYLGNTGLKNTVAKLNAKEDVNILVYGDSISTGANSSSVLGISPKLPTWIDMLGENLSSWYGANVTVKNRSVGGWTSSNGVGGGIGWVNGQQVSHPGLADQFATGELKGFVPDVALIGFGMNDATMGNPTINIYCTNIMNMIDTIRGINPDCEIILIGTMLANPLAKNQSKNQTEYTSFLSKVADRYENVSIIDIAVMHQELLDAGKQYTEMSSNNVNHPNDFFARIYAMHFLSAFIDFGTDAGTEDGGEGEGTSPSELAAHEEFLQNGYSALFSDPYLKNGISVIDNDSHDVSGVIAGTNATGAPSWTYAQWGSKYNLYEYGNRNYFNGGDAFTYISKGEKINGETVPGKVLTVDSTTGSIYMELNAQVEYDRPRQDGEDWPHMLLSQDFGGNLVHVSELDDLVMHMDYEMTKFEDCMGSTADTNKHCAQLVWYITLQNRTQGHKDYGSYVWFGITLWDNRMAGGTFGGYAAEDGGKADATHAFIYQPASNLIHDGKNIPTVGQQREVNFHALEAARAGFELAKERGYLGDTQWEDIYIGGMNFGFENTGTYNSAVQVNSVGVYYK